jgi:hypothetical protein
MSDLDKYRTQLRNHPMTNIGYARKSPGKERFEVRRSLLQKMVTRLQDRCLCTKVYISPSSKSDEPLMDRDKKKDNSKFVNSITGCNGDMKGNNFMLLCSLLFIVHNFVALKSLLDKKFKPIRLVVIDYAGFSTEPNDVRHFFE